MPAPPTPIPADEHRKLTVNMIHDPAPHSTPLPARRSQLLEFMPVSVLADFPSRCYTASRRVET
ncbi:hypothetical protein EX30DRAFT_340722 [Ascodesmis nigricans]|uniref:Uncharacterized protein n=1 Tax=Ascodesmis nigricans TaxID=341454 RepID=A0A4S2MXL1_9PEZI|nr:hypothetical protein EX30DRAFT_340722 [Ascodesmis nigricans]